MCLLPDGFVNIAFKIVFSNPRSAFMKKLTPLLLLVASMAYGQAQKQGPSQFDKFVQTPSIEWAMYVEDTIQLETPHLNKILAKRFEKNEIKAAYALEVEWGDLNNIRFSKKKDLDNHVLVPRIDTTYDSTGYTNPVSSAQRNNTIDSPHSTSRA